MIEQPPSLPPTNPHLEKILGYLKKTPSRREIIAVGGLYLLCKVLADISDNELLNIEDKREAKKKEREDSEASQYFEKLDFPTKISVRISAAIKISTELMSDKIFYDKFPVSIPKLHDQAILLQVEFTNLIESNNDVFKDKSNLKFPDTIKTELERINNEVLMLNSKLLNISNRKVVMEL